MAFEVLQSELGLLMTRMQSEPGIGMNSISSSARS